MREEIVRVEITGNKVQWRDQQGKLHVAANGERVTMPKHVADKEWRQVRVLPPITNQQDFPGRRTTAMPKGGAAQRGGAKG